MLTVTPRSQAVKPRLTLQVSLDHIDGISRSALTVTDGTRRGECAYWLERILCDFPASVAYRLEKVHGFPGSDREENVYHVLLVDDPADQHDDCSCKGHVRWGHCRHVDSLRALRAGGIL